MKNLKKILFGAGITAISFMPLKNVWGQTQNVESGKVVLEFQSPIDYKHGRISVVYHLSGDSIFKVEYMDMYRPINKFKYKVGLSSCGPMFDFDCLNTYLIVKGKKEETDIGKKARRHFINECKKVRKKTQFWPEGEYSGKLL